MHSAFQGTRFIRPDDSSPDLLITIQGPAELCAGHDSNHILKPVDGTVMEVGGGERHVAKRRNTPDAFFIGDGLKAFVFC